jgi:ABC-type Fe3+/spermidine/putrescine transport system ATPase subunit
MNNGRVGTNWYTSRNSYDNPTSEFVMRFIGEPMLFQVRAAIFP